MIKPVNLPKGFLNSLSLKTQKELQEVAETFQFTEFMTDENYYKIENCETPNRHSSNWLSSVIERYNHIVLVKFNGFFFNESSTDVNLKQFVELYKKAKELDELKRSLSSISGVLKDVVK